MKTILLPALYLPPISWFYQYLNPDFEVEIEQYENIPKQTLRNRTQIFGANGKLNLTIPLKKNGKRALKDIEISYNEDWQNRHWKSIKNVYQSAPYFEYYEDKLRLIFHKQIDSLLAFNLYTIEVMLSLLKANKNHKLTTIFEKKPAKLDYREKFQSKKDSLFNLTQYYQVFSDKMGFINDLSILDLLCNLGPEAIPYIQQQKLQTE